MASNDIDLVNSPLQTQEDTSTLGFILILFAVGWGVLFVLWPYHTLVNPRIPDHRTYRTLQNLKVADDYFRMDFNFQSAFESEWYPIYRTNWMAELTAGENAVLNNRKINFANVRMIAGEVVDHWDQPIRSISITNEKGYLALAFYSVGADGISRSHGNDPDDVNSWNESRPWESLYRSARERTQSRRAPLGLALWCFIFFAGICFRFGGSRSAGSTNTLSG